MKFNIVLISLMIACCTICFIACTSKNIEDIVGVQGCDTTATSYTAVIKPILDANCNTSGCHNSTDRAFAINLEDHADLQAVALTPRFLGSIRHQDPFFKMPKNQPKLNDCQIKKIAIWVANGALNN